MSGKCLPHKSWMIEVSEKNLPYGSENGFFFFEMISILKLVWKNLLAASLLKFLSVFFLKLFSWYFHHWSFLCFFKIFYSRNFLNRKKNHILSCFPEEASIFWRFIQVSLFCCLVSQVLSPLQQIFVDLSNRISLAHWELSTSIKNKQESTRNA